MGTSISANSQSSNWRTPSSSDSTKRSESSTSSPAESDQIPTVEQALILIGQWPRESYSACQKEAFQFLVKSGLMTYQQVLQLTPIRKEYLSHLAVRFALELNAEPESLWRNLNRLSDTQLEKAIPFGCTANEVLANINLEIQKLDEQTKQTMALFMQREDPK